MAPVSTHSALAAAVASLTLAGTEAFVLPYTSCVSTAATSCTTRNEATPFAAAAFASRPSLVLLRAEEEGHAEEGGAEEPEASAAPAAEEGEGKGKGKQEKEKEEDPEVVEIKQTIADLESQIRAKRNDLASIVDSVEPYSKDGYARRVAEMDQIQKNRGAASKSNESTAKASILADFLPVLDELAQLDHRYAEDELAKSYKALRWDLSNAMQSLGMAEYTAEVGTQADPSRFETAEEQYSDDYPKGTIISSVEVGLELKGNVMRMAKVAVSLGSEADAGAAAAEEEGDVAPDDGEVASGL